MTTRNQLFCTCCGFVTQKPGLCTQCLFAGCDKKKKGERCYLNMGAAAPRPHLAPHTNLDACAPGAESQTGKLSIERNIT